MLLTIAHHYPRREHVGAFLAFRAEIDTGMAGNTCPGQPRVVPRCGGAPPGGDRSLGVRRGSSGGGPRLMSIGEPGPEWSARPDEVLRLELVTR